MNDSAWPSGSCHKKKQTVRRRLMQGAGILSIASLIAACGFGSDNNKQDQRAEELVTLQWGGVWERGIIPLSEAFEEETGIPIKNTTSSGSKLTILAQNEGQYDMAWVIGNQAAKGVQTDILSPIDVSKVDAWDSLYEPLVEAVNVDGEYGGVPISYGVQGILWRPDLVPFEIEHWEDLWRPELKDKIALQDAPNLGSIFTVMAAAEAFEGDYRDLESGWAHVERLVPNVKFLFESDADALNQLAEGDIWAVVTMADFGLEALEGVDIEVTVPEEGSPWSPQYVVIPSASERQDDIYKFINYLLTEENQIEWVQKERVAPGNSAVDLPAEVQDTIVETPEVAENLWYIDWLEIGETSEEWTERWTKLFN